MKIVVSMDSFKGSLTSHEACICVKNGVEKSGIGAEAFMFPMADGGEGTVDAMVLSCKGEYISCEVLGAFSEKRVARFASVNGGKTAVIEMAAASGITPYKKDELSPFDATTFGVGQLILKAAELGFKDIIVGFGGSATNDGGMGALQALGTEFFDDNNNVLGLGAKNLAKVNKIDFENLSEKLSGINFTFACDVENTFFGENGATYVFGPQKGVKKEDVKTLDEAMEHFSKMLCKYSGRDIANIKGSGAAGGLCGGLLSVLDAKIKPGFTVLSDATGLEKEIETADLVITGEGKTDSQTISGKFVQRIGEMAKKYNVPVICISGSYDYPCDKLYESGINACFGIATGPMELSYAMDNAASLLEETTQNILRVLRIGDKS